MQINHNIPALRALNSLNKTNSVADKHMRNLSSGLRINSAADDAAGMAISNKMKTQVRGLERASMNAEDGISLVQTAEGALGEVHSMLQRMRELAVQGANGTLEAADRRAIQMEVEQLKDEITSTANLTQFNKLSLLNGQLDRRSFTDQNTIAQSAYVSDTVTPGIYDFDVVAIGSKATKTMKNAMQVSSGITEEQAGIININGEEVKITVGMKKDDVFAAIRDLAETVDLTLTRDTSDKLMVTSNEAGSKQKITIFSDNADLLKAAGLDAISEENAITGADAIVKLDPASSFGVTATATANGNRVEITDANYKKMYVDLSVNDSGTELMNGTKVLNIAKSIESEGDNPKFNETVNRFNFKFSGESDALNGGTVEFVTAGTAGATISASSPYTITVSTGGAEIHSLSASTVQNEINKALINNVDPTIKKISVAVTDATQIKSSLVIDNGMGGTPGTQPTFTGTETELDDFTFSFTSGASAALNGCSIVYEVGYDGAAIDAPTANITGNTLTVYTKGGAGLKTLDASKVQTAINNKLLAEGITLTIGVSGIPSVTTSVDTTKTISGGAYTPNKLVLGGLEFQFDDQAAAALDGYAIRVVEDSNLTATEVTVEGKVITVTSKDLSAMTGADLETALNDSSLSPLGSAVVFEDMSGGAAYNDSPLSGHAVTIGNNNSLGGLLEAKQSVTLNVLDAGPLQLQVGANEGMKIEIQIPKLTATALGLEFINMRTATGASEAITLCDKAIAEISAVRSKLGAYQNRLEYTINNLNATTENTTAALSRIEDADMAYEMAEYTQKNVISQAGISMLSQANQRPQQVLQLLQ